MEPRSRDILGRLRAIKGFVTRYRLLTQPIVQGLDGGARSDVFSLLQQLVETKQIKAHQENQISKMYYYAKGYRVPADPTHRLGISMSHIACDRAIEGTNASLILSSLKKIPSRSGVVEPDLSVFLKFDKQDYEEQALSDRFLCSQRHYSRSEFRIARKRLEQCGLVTFRCQREPHCSLFWLFLRGG